MTPDNLIADLARQNVRLWAKEGKVHFDAPKGVVTADVLARVRRDKPEILKYLAEMRNGLRICSDARHPDADEFPQFAAALQLGRLVLCRRCQHYDGPFERQLGWCRHHETETAPDVVSTCSAASYG